MNQPESTIQFWDTPFSNIPLPWHAVAIPCSSQLNTVDISPCLTQPLMRVVKATMSGVAPALKDAERVVALQKHQTLLLEMDNELDLS